MPSDRRYRRFLLRVAKAARDRCLLGELTKVNVPTMIIRGRDDSITLLVAEPFRDTIPDARLESIDHCGHSPPIERPKEFARILHSLLADLASPKPGPGSTLGLL